MAVMKMAMGAKVIVDKGGGIGIAIIVVTAIKADITAVKASLTLALVDGQVSDMFSPSASIIWFRF
jgi:hypothetical protein